VLTITLFLNSGSSLSQRVTARNKKVKEMENLESITKHLKDKSLLHTLSLIDGEWTGSDDNRYLSITNPFSDEIIAEIPQVTNEQIEKAIQAAHTAFKTWKNILVTDRAALLKKWNDLILANAEDLATIMVLEQGKPLKEAIGEIEYAASYIEFYAEEAKRIYGDILPSPFADTRILIIKQPVGVVGIITPWNFPAAMMMRKVAPALASGCTCVVKPDKNTPLTAIALIELSVRAGIPKGVVNLITGNSAKIGEAFAKSKLMSKISFTGSTEVGKLLMKNSSDTLKKITLELGGNAPFIVFEDANIENAVNGLINSKFRNAGQTCVCANRVFIHKTILNEFCNKLTERVAELKVGNGLNDIDIGPLINQEAIEKIEYLITDATNNGAEITTGGKRHKLGKQFFEPTILVNITPEMDIFCTEIFGPVVAIVSFNSVDEVIKLANDTRYGLASYFYSSNMNTIWKVAEEIEYGMVGVNSGSISSALIPFGGVKESGFGREGSRYGIEDYLNIKYIHLKNN
jgi:succinate-semialdehyde dehydrogenase / glutarate-semialdehyde dehydrogenase